MALLTIFTRKDIKKELAKRSTKCIDQTFYYLRLIGDVHQVSHDNAFNMAQILKYIHHIQVIGRQNTAFKGVFGSHETVLVLLEIIT